MSVLLIKPSTHSPLNILEYQSLIGGSTILLLLCLAL
jgi:hypothetical protein